MLCMALVAAGCGGDDDDKSKDAKKAKPSKQEQAIQDDRDAKEKNVTQAKKDFKKSDEDVGACRNLAMAYVALASPASTGDPKNPPKPPKDREKSMKKAIDTLEQCRDIDSKDRDVQQMLASSYMGMNQYDKASDLLEDLAKSAKGQEKANAYYAWGLAASNAQQLDKAISAWETFLELAPKNDPRIAQIRQSIKALKAAKAQPAPAQPADSGDKDDSKDDA
jgi:tetratricopeptide (TPR) repeat protein